MKKIFDIIIEFVKENSLYFIIGILLFISISSWVRSCNDDHIDDIVEHVDVNALRRHIIDSIATELHSKYIGAIDSIESLRTQERAKLNKSIVYLDKDNKKLRKKIDELLSSQDTIDIETCKEIVDLQREVIENRDIVIVKKDSVINSYKLTVQDMSLKFNAQYNETARVRVMYTMCQGDVTYLKEEINKQKTWWKRNEKWFYLGAGILGTALIAR